jgi:hypothetical protein
MMVMNSFVDDLVMMMCQCHNLSCLLILQKDLDLHLQSFAVQSQSFAYITDYTDNPFVPCVCIYNKTEDRQC